MAVPRVFVSSTCYDLADVRDMLVSFIEAFGFQPALSERGDVFYHPDLHTHDACLNEVSNCQLFVLIIGGRFGGTYVADAAKSIVNAEYAAAKEGDIPVFTFVKREVLEDHRVYQKNVQKEDIVGKITFPSVEKQEHAQHIFAFIDSVRRARVNNGFFPFEYARDIETLLRKQWAGMFFDFLARRRVRDQFETTNTALSALSLASTKLENLVKSLYKHVGPADAEDAIRAVDAKAAAEKFFTLLFSGSLTRVFPTATQDELLALDLSVPWDQFLTNTGDLREADVRAPDGRNTKVVYSVDPDILVDVAGAMDEGEERRSKDMAEAYEYLKALEPDQRKELFSQYGAKGS